MCVLVSDKNSTSWACFRSSHWKRNSWVLLFFWGDWAYWNSKVWIFCIPFCYYVNFEVVWFFLEICSELGLFVLIVWCSDSRPKIAFVTFKDPQALEIALLLSVKFLFNVVWFLSIVVVYMLSNFCQFKLWAWNRSS